MTAVQREVFLALLETDKTAGIVACLRKAGVDGTRGELRRLYDDDQELQEQARLARGWNLNRVEGVCWEVAVNPEHSHWDRANARILKAYDPRFRDQATLEVSGGMEVTSDVSDSIDRFTAAVVQLAARNGTGDSAGEAGRPDESGARLRLGEVDRPA